MTAMTSAVASATQILSVAAEYLGVPYLWGGTTPKGFDCSGFTQYVYQQATGVNIGRTTGDQYSSASLETVPMTGQYGLDAAQPGDLVYFGMSNASPSDQHVGIVVSTAGGGTMIDAPYTGTVVRYDSISAHAGTDEPISGIRRLASGGNAYLSSVNSTGQAGVATGSASISTESGISFWQKVEGACLLIAGGIIGLTGLFVLAKGEMPDSLGRLLEAAMV